jgi:interleukin-1 receptor-associated kinase 1
MTCEHFQNVRADAARLRRSPADVLITRWSSLYGHNVTELFKLLSLMKHYQAMTAIKDLVDQRYHVWFNSSQSANFEGKKLNVGAQSQIFRELPKKETSPKEDNKENLKDLLNIPEIPVEELEKATNNWSKENELGRGGFGVVYKGEWLSTQVAIKKIEYRESRSGSSKEHWVQSLNELRHLNHCRHDNILPIYGYAIKGEVCLVVYKLLPGGSLEDRLAKRGGFEPLTWPLRWNIAKGTARFDF